MTMKGGSGVDDAAASIPSACRGRTPGVVSGRTRTNEPGEKIGPRNGVGSRVDTTSEEGREPVPRSWRGASKGVKKTAGSGYTRIAARVIRTREGLAAFGGIRSGDKRYADTLSSVNLPKFLPATAALSTQL